MPPLAPFFPVVAGAAVQPQPDPDPRSYGTPMLPSELAQQQQQAVEGIPAGQLTSAAPRPAAPREPPTFQPPASGMDATVDLPPEAQPTRLPPASPVTPEPPQTPMLPSEAARQPQPQQQPAAPATEGPPPPKGTEDLVAYAQQAAERNGVDPRIFVRQINQESGFNPTAKSPAGATGIAQFMPVHWNQGQFDPYDPKASLDHAAALMGSYLREYGGDYAKALAAYNAGPGAVQRYGGVPPFQETQTYVRNILGGQHPPAGAADYPAGSGPRGLAPPQFAGGGNPGSVTLAPAPELPATGANDPRRFVGQTMGASEPYSGPDFTKIPVVGDVARLLGAPVTGEEMAGRGNPLLGAVKGRMTPEQQKALADITGLNPDIGGMTGQQILGRAGVTAGQFLPGAFGAVELPAGAALRAAGRVAGPAVRSIAEAVGPIGRELLASERGSLGVPEDELAKLEATGTSVPPPEIPASAGMTPGEAPAPKLTNAQRVRAQLDAEQQRLADMRASRGQPPGETPPTGTGGGGPPTGASSAGRAKPAGVFDYLALRTPQQISDDLVAHAATWPDRAAQRMADWRAVVAEREGLANLPSRTVARVTSGFTPNDLVAEVNDELARKTDVIDHWTNTYNAQMQKALAPFRFEGERTTPVWGGMTGQGEKSGRILNLTPKVGASSNATGTHVNPMPTWNSFLEHISQYSLTPEQDAAVQDLVKIRDAMRAYEKVYGIKTGDVSVPEGIYSHRQVVGNQVNGETVLKPKSTGTVQRGGSLQGSQKARGWQDIEDAMGNGVVYDDRPVATETARAKQGLTAVLDKWYADQMRPLGQKMNGTGTVLKDGQFWRTPQMPEQLSRYYQDLKFPAGVADRIEAAYKPASNNMLMTANRWVNSLLTMGHPAWGFVQGESGLYRNPAMWGRANAAGLRAMVDPLAQSNYFDANQGILSKLLPHGLNWSAYNMPGEFGSEISRYHIPVLGPVAKAGNIHMGASGNVLRTEWAKLLYGPNGEKLAGLSPKALQAAAEELNNATGWSGGKLTTAEKMLGFAPRFFRAKINMLLRVANVTDNSAPAWEARRTLLQGLALSAATTEILNRVRGKQTEWDLNKPHAWEVRQAPTPFGEINVPLMPYKEIYRALWGLTTGLAMAAQGKIPQGATAAGSSLGWLAYSNAGKIPQDIMNQIRGFDVQNQPVGLVDPATRVTNAENIAIGHLPIALQGSVDAATGRGSFAAALGRLPGLPVSPSSPAELRDEARENAAALAGTKGTLILTGPNAGQPVQAWEDLNVAQQKQALAENPDLAAKTTAAAQKAAIGPKDHVQQETDEWFKGQKLADETRESALKAGSAAMLAGKLSLKDFHKMYETATTAYAGALQNQDKLHPEALTTQQKQDAYRVANGTLPPAVRRPEDVLASQYHAIPMPTDNVGRPDFRAWKQAQADFLAPLDDVSKKYILDHPITKEFNDPTVQQAVTRLNKIRDTVAPFYVRRDQLEQNLATKAAVDRVNAALAVSNVKGAGYWKQQPAYQAYTRALHDFRVYNPTVDAAGVALGYFTARAKRQ